METKVKNFKLSAIFDSLIGVKHYLSSDHVQKNKFRMGSLGRSDVELAVQLTDHALKTCNEIDPATILPFDDEIKFILGTMCFQVINVAQTLRVSGVEINKRAEDEQASVLHWYLTMYLRHGPEGWREACLKFLNDERAKEIAKVAATHTDNKDTPA